MITSVFFRFTLRLILIAVVILLAVRLIGRLLPPSMLTLITSGTDGVPCDKPCLFGIRPGATSIADAVRILHLHPLTRNATWQDDHTLQLRGPAAYVSFSQTPDGKVDFISLTDNLYDTGVAIPGSLADSYALGDVVLAFGAISVGLPGSDYFVVEVPALGMQAAIARPSDLKVRMRPTTPLSSLTIYVARPCPAENAGEVHHWLGFKTLLQYFTDRGTYPIKMRATGYSMPPFATCPQ